MAKESTRLQCVALNAAQSSLDPKELREWIPNAEYGGHAFGFAAPHRSRPEEFELLIANREKVLPWIKEYSPIELVSKGDPPVYNVFFKQDELAVVGERQKDPTHTAIYGIKLAEKLESLGIECVVTYPALKDNQDKYGSMQKFLIEKLKGNGG